MEPEHSDIAIEPLGRALARGRFGQPGRELGPSGDWIEDLA